MKLHDCDHLSFHVFAKEWSREKGGSWFTNDDAATLLYRGFWKREFDHANQTRDGKTCLTFPFAQGGRRTFDPATREMIRQLLPTEDPGWQLK